MNKQKVAVIFGGQSAEHEVSVRSAKTVVAGLDNEHCEPQVIYISQKGKWYWWGKEAFLKADLESLKASSDKQEVNLLLGDDKHTWMMRTNHQELYSSDVIFPLVHGTHGEDGHLQGLLEMANIPYVGAGVLSSAVCMDKAITKQLTYDAGILTCRWLVAHQQDSREKIAKEVESNFGYPCFVKPARLGSSVGINKVNTSSDLKKALDFAFRYDEKIIIEENIKGRELEISVLGNYEAKASWPGELIVHHEFYSYEAKYIDPNGATVVNHADLDPAIVANLQKAALEVYRVLECSGMARVDFFLTAENKAYFNEINTIPGFTSISMYPKTWEESGLKLSELLKQLVELAKSRYEEHRQLSHHFETDFE